MNRRRDVRSWFERHYIPEPNSGCFIWLGTLTRYGYGQIRINSEIHAAHRLSYELVCGTVPEGLSVLHHCDNRCCVNPNHLYAGTEADNIADRIRRGPEMYGRINAGAKLLEVSHVLS